MKKSELKSFIKSVKQSYRKEIELGVVDTLKKVTEKFGAGSKGLTKEIERSAKQLAKKLSKDIKMDKSAAEIVNNGNKTAVRIKRNKAAVNPKTQPVSSSETIKPVLTRAKKTETAKPVAPRVKTKVVTPAEDVKDVSATDNE